LLSDKQTDKHTDERRALHILVGGCDKTNNPADAINAMFRMRNRNELEVIMSRRRHHSSVNSTHQRHTQHTPCEWSSVTSHKLQQQIRHIMQHCHCPSPLLLITRDVSDSKF